MYNRLTDKCQFCMIGVISFFDMLNHFAFEFCTEYIFSINMQYSRNICIYMSYLFGMEGETRRLPKKSKI